MSRRHLVLLAILAALTTSLQSQTTPSRWLEHVERDLAGLWMRDDLAGDPPGSFPTFICADGAPLVESNPCPAFAKAPEWIRSEIGRQYVRMVSRQTYAYGVIFHLTGNETALERARAGTRFIMERAWDPETGSVATFLVDGRPGPEPPQRTTQSLAYALVGPSFYYYLTRDPEVLAFIRAVRSHIFERYWSDDWRMLRWTLADFGDDTANRKELVAQLDQINAYMLLMLPLLETDERKAWESDLRRLVDAMLRDFHDADSRRFFGYIHDERGRVWGERHNDFGHTVKAYWMLYLVGRKIGDDALARLASSGIDSSLRAAFVRREVAGAPEWQAGVMREAAGEDGFYYVWSNRPDGIGIAWWEWCELDQAAATMALADPAYARFLDETYRTFFAALVDPVHGGTYGFPGAVDGPKGHHWQNGYHAAEHALVGYVTSAIVRKEPFRLFFAFPGTLVAAVAPPHYFEATESGRRAMETMDGGLRKTLVTYSPARSDLTRE